MSQERPRDTSAFRPRVDGQVAGFTEGGRDRHAEGSRDVLYEVYRPGSETGCSLGT